jgi:hypothetical protein
MPLLKRKIMKSFDDFDTEVQCEEFYDPDWTDSDPDLDEVQDDDWWHDLDPYGEEDPEWDPPLQDQHGLTADGYALLADMDSEGDFV